MNAFFGLIFGIIAMITWGSADFLVALAVRKNSVLSTVFLSQALGLSIFIFFALLFFAFPPLSTSLILLVVASGLLGAMNYLTLYKALEVGKTSIVSPISGSWGAGVFLLGIIFLGERVNVFQAISVLLIFLGVVAISIKKETKKADQKLAPGVVYALLSMASASVYTVFLDMLVSEIGWFMAIFLVRILVTLFLGILVLVNKKTSLHHLPLLPSSKKTLVLIALVGILEFVGIVAFSLGISFEYSALVAPVSAAFPFITVLLAYFILRDKLQLYQKAGIAFIISGLVLLALKI